jgi:hypothetical protein
MRKTSRILGIVGSSVAVAFGLLFIVMGGVFSALFQSDLFYNEFGTAMMSTMVTIYFVVGALSIVSAIPGFIAVALVTKKNTTAGALNIVAAVLAIPTTVSMVLFILAAVFAYKQEKPKTPPVMYVPVPGAYPAGYPVYYQQPGYQQPGAYPPPYGYNPAAAPGAYPQQPQPAPAPGSAYPPPPAPAAPQASPGDGSNKEEL